MLVFFVVMRRLCLGGVFAWCGSRRKKEVERIVKRNRDETCVG